MVEVMGLVVVTVVERVEVVGLMVVTVVVETVEVIVLEVSGYGSESARCTLPRIPLYRKEVAPLLSMLNRTNIVPDRAAKAISRHWELLCLEHVL